MLETKELKSPSGIFQQTKLGAVPLIINGDKDRLGTHLVSYSQISFYFMVNCCARGFKLFKLFVSRYLLTNAILIPLLFT